MTDDFVIPEEALEAAVQILDNPDCPGRHTWYHSHPPCPACDSTRIARAALEAALPHLRAHQIERAHEEWEPMVRRLVDAELRHYGYTDEQIALANLDRPHTSDCEFDANHQGWVCTDENGKSFHPEWDEATDVAGVISRALEALLPTEAETKALAETATHYGYELGRKAAAEDIRVAIEKRRLKRRHRWLKSHRWSAEAESAWSIGMSNACSIAYRYGRDTRGTS